MNELNVNNQQLNLPNVLLLRGSIFLFVMKLVVTLLLFSALRIFIRLPILYFDLSKQSLLQLYNINTAIILLMIFFEVTFLVMIVLSWVNEYYEILPGKIIHRKGVLTRKEKVFACAHVQSIDLSQGIMGRIFNFGSLTLFSPALEEKIYLYNIDSPLTHQQLIQNIINMPEGPEDKGKSSIFFQRTV